MYFLLFISFFLACRGRHEETRGERENEFNFYPVPVIFLPLRTIGRLREKRGWFKSKTSQH